LRLAAELGADAKTAEAQGEQRLLRATAVLLVAYARDGDGHSDAEKGSLGRLGARAEMIRTGYKKSTVERAVTVARLIQERWKSALVPEADDSANVESMLSVLMLDFSAAHPGEAFTFRGFERAMKAKYSPAKDAKGAAHDAAAGAERKNLADELGMERTEVIKLETLDASGLFDTVRAILDICAENHATDYADLLERVGGECATRLATWAPPMKQAA
jgi:hypothetical protein